jgi:hypothetical protein
VRYLMMICTDEQWYAAQGAEDLAGFTREYAAWVEQAAERGVLQGGERLRPTSDSTTVRVRDGETLTSDGPFAETKEQIGGYFVVDCKDLDEAIELAARLPGARHGAIEVRPIWEM